VLDVDRLQAEVGATIELRDVLLLSGGDTPRVGSPHVEGAMVLAEVLEHGRDAKLVVFKYKNKTRYRRRHGHRQDFTRLAIRDILVDGKKSAAKDDKAEEKPKRPARKRVAKADQEPTAAAEATEPGVEAIAGEPDAEAKPKRAATRRPKAATGGASKPRAEKPETPEDAPAAEPSETAPEEE
jgi:large subunit ribosomal protein L21